MPSEIAGEPTEINFMEYINSNVIYLEVNICMILKQYI